MNSPNELDQPNVNGRIRLVTALLLIALGPVACSDEADRVMDSEGHANVDARPRVDPESSQPRVQPEPPPISPKIEEEVPESTPPAQCSSGETASRSCGNCGTQRRTCHADGTWGKWGKCSAKECHPGEVRMLPCERCGQRQDTCSSQCTWTQGMCIGMGACSPGEQQACPKIHDTCSQGKMQCSSSCTWGACSGASCSKFPVNTVASDFHCGTNIFETSICRYGIEAHCPVGSVATGKCTAPVNLSGKGNCFFESLPQQGDAVARAQIRMEIGAGHGMDCRVAQCFCRYLTP
jgi:hypothetical protein